MQNHPPEGGVKHNNMDLSIYKETIQNQQLNTAGVTPSAFGYRFSVISNRNNQTLGTGFFKSSRKMTEDEQLRFFHQYTHGMYQKKEAFVSIDIFEAEA